VRKMNRSTERAFNNLGEWLVRYTSTFPDITFVRDNEAEQIRIHHKQCPEAEAVITWGWSDYPRQPDSGPSDHVYVVRGGVRGEDSSWPCGKYHVPAQAVHMAVKEVILTWFENQSCDA
jgi:hypothetical protein